MNSLPDFDPDNVEETMPETKPREYRPTKEDFDSLADAYVLMAAEGYGVIISADIVELSETMRRDKTVKTIELRSDNPHEAWDSPVPRCAPVYPSIKQYFRLLVTDRNSDWRLGDRVKIIVVRDDNSEPQKNESNKVPY